VFRPIVTVLRDVVTKSDHYERIIAYSHH